MSEKEYAEDTVFWSLKRSTQFSARRRTITLFLAHSTNSTPTTYSWIDNTPLVWTELLDVLEAQNPASIAINVDTQIAFSSGLHVGELKNILDEFPKKWRDRLVGEPMLGVEFIATMPRQQLGWYKRIQETAWAMIGEGFSGNVIVPGKTNTEVRS